ncbi:hypothetical protein C0J52_02393, partial [Blattella germanica]
SLQKILTPGDALTPPCRKAEYHFTVKQDVQICSMVTTEKFLLIGMVGEITGWDWKSIISNKNRKLAFSIQIPTAKDALEKPDVNSMVCGGGPRLSLWHLRSLDVTTAFQLDDAGIHVAMFYDDRIMAGGASPNFYNLNYTGDIYAQIPFSSTCIYSVVYQEQPLKVCLTAIEKRIICN